MTESIKWLHTMAQPRLYVDVAATDKTMGTFAYAGRFDESGESESLSTTLAIIKSKWSCQVQRSGIAVPAEPWQEQLMGRIISTMESYGYRQLTVREAKGVEIIEVSWEMWDSRQLVKLMARRDGSGDCAISLSTVLPSTGSEGRGEAVDALATLARVLEIPSTIVEDASQAASVIAELLDEALHETSGTQ